MPTVGSRSSIPRMQNKDVVNMKNQSSRPAAENRKRVKSWAAISAALGADDGRGTLAGRYRDASSGECGVSETMDACNALRLAGMAAGSLLCRRVGTLENLACAGLSAGISSATAAHRRRQHIILSGLRVLHFFRRGRLIHYDNEQLSGVFPDPAGLAGQ